MKYFISLPLFIAGIFFPNAAFAAVDLCPKDSRFGTLCSINEGATGSIASTIMTTLLILAVVLALLFLIWGGIKWITSGGDKGAIEAARIMIVSAIVGLVLAFLSFFLVNMVYNFITGNSITTFTIPTLF